MYIFSSFNIISQVEGVKLCHNTITDCKIKYTENFEAQLPTMLKQPLIEIDGELNCKMRQIMVAELLSRGIIIPEEESNNEEEYLYSLLNFKSAEGTFFNKSKITEYKLETWNQKTKKIIFCGIPCDIGAGRPGSRYGPKLLRDKSNNLFFRGHESVLLDISHKADPLHQKDIYDIGDVFLRLGSRNSYIEKVRRASSSIYKVGIPFFIGGDHLFTFPIVEGIYQQRQSAFTIVQLDYHLDVQTWGEFENCAPKRLTEPTHANFISWIKKNMPEINTIQVGINNYQNVSDSEQIVNVLSYLQDVGTQISNLDIFLSQNKDLFNRLPKNQDVYLTVDVDILNCLYIPNTGYPASMGINLEQFFCIVKYVCENNNIIGVDLMEFGKNYSSEDHSRMADIAVNAMLLILKYL